MVTHHGEIEIIIIIIIIIKSLFREGHLFGLHQFSIRPSYNTKYA